MCAKGAVHIASRHRNTCAVAHSPECGHTLWTPAFLLELTGGGVDVRVLVRGFVTWYRPTGGASASQRKADRRGTARARPRSAVPVASHHGPPPSPHSLTH